MKFDFFWQDLCKKVITKRKFETLIQHKPFTVYFEKDKIMAVPDKSHDPRSIYHKDFLQVWNKAQKLSKSEQFKQSNYKKMTRNASYILALMKFVLENEEIE